MKINGKWTMKFGPNWLKISDVAEKLRLCAATIRKYAKKYDWKRIQRGKRGDMYIDWNSVEKWLEELPKDGEKRLIKKIEGTLHKVRKELLGKGE